MMISAPQFRCAAVALVARQRSQPAEQRGRNGAWELIAVQKALLPDEDVYLELAGVPLVTRIAGDDGGAGGTAGHTEPLVTGDAAAAAAAAAAAVQDAAAQQDVQQGIIVIDGCDDDDGAAIGPMDVLGGGGSSAGGARCRLLDLHVVYHHSYRVPVLMLRAREQDGRPVSDREVLRTLPVARECRSQEEIWKVITKEDHPLLHRPWLMLHPCATATVMGLVLGGELQHAQRMPQRPATMTPANRRAAAAEGGESWPGLQVVGAALGDAATSTVTGATPWASSVGDANGDDDDDSAQDLDEAMESLAAVAEAQEASVPTADAGDAGGSPEQAPLAVGAADVDVSHQYEELGHSYAVMPGLFAPGDEATLLRYLTTWLLLAGNAVGVSLL